MGDLSIIPRPLAELREAHRTSAADLAAAVGVTERAVYAWERRESALSAARVRAIAGALGLGDADELALLRWAADRGEASRV
jgi:transcriptional regulator with XRE-family HTH domain